MSALDAQEVGQRHAAEGEGVVGDDVEALAGQQLVEQLVRRGRDGALGAAPDGFAQAGAQHGAVPASELEWMAVAQRRGLPTRLLDWTENILAAAFFATKNAGVSGDALLLHLKEAESSREQQIHSNSVRRIYRPPHISPRIPAQRSVFTVHPNPTHEFTSKSLHKWRISSAACLEIKRVLDACAVHEGVSTRYRRLVQKSRMALQVGQTMTPNLAVNADAPRLGFARLSRAGYLAR